MSLTQAHVSKLKAMAMDLIVAFPHAKYIYPLTYYLLQGTMGISGKKILRLYEEKNFTQYFSKLLLNSTFTGKYISCMSQKETCFV